MFSKDPVALALATEQRVYPNATLLTRHQDVGVAKSLMVRPTGTPVATISSIRLVPITTEAQWSVYADRRVEVEAGFGADESHAREMVYELRHRCARIDLDVFAAMHQELMIGGIARFRLPAPHEHWARLQEVDIFPRWRGRGHGSVMLSSMMRLLGGEGSAMAVVGADEDDWPITWYRRHGFREVARVAKCE